MKKLKIILVDDEMLALEKVIEQTKTMDFIDSVHGASSPTNALEALRLESFDVAILDIEMFGMNGIELAKRCKQLQPKIKIIFLTGHSQYAIDAFQIRANGYLLKPVSNEALQEEILYAVSYSPQPSAAPIRIQTFGNFEIFVAMHPIEFERHKSKELLAYLVSRKGAYVNGEELLSILYEDRPITTSSKSQLRNLIASLSKSLKSANAEQILLKKRNQLAVDTTSFSCDYYEFLQGDVNAINSYMGEFMCNYSWAEFVTGYLENSLNKRNLF